MKNLFMLIVVLILPALSCLGQEDYYDQKKNKVLVDPEDYIDDSIIASEWMLLRKKVKEQDSVIRAKDKIINDLNKSVYNGLAQIEDLTGIIIEKNEEVDNIADDQIKTAAGLFSRLRIQLELDTSTQEWNNIQASGILKYDMKKVYIFTRGTAGNNISDVRIGIGYNIL